MIELVNQLRIFDYFSPFVRSLEEIFVDSAQIIAMFSIIVFFQGIIIWTLDNQITYPGMKGLGNSFIQSYFLALGDFGVSESFDGAKLEWLFWIIFIITTYLSLLIILNMVIAIMDGTF